MSGKSSLMNLKGLGQSYPTTYLIWIFCIICIHPFQVLSPSWSHQQVPWLCLCTSGSISSETKGVSGTVAERVREAHQNKLAPMMMLFPEGTTTNGNFLLPSKQVHHMILLLCHAYLSLFGKISKFVNHIEVTRLPVYYPSEQEKEDPKLYANNVRKLMAPEGNLILSDIGLAEKRSYHAALKDFFRQQ